jgi:imidazolonepropionase-like amidohydrolase
MLLIRNALILTMAGETHQPGYLLIDAPLIKAVGSGEPPAGMAGLPEVTLIDAGGGWLMPGMIDAHCHIGIYNDGLAVDIDDGNEMTDPITPQLRAIDGIFQDDRCFSEALAAGVTGAMTGPGSANVLAGSFALLRTTGRTVESMAIKPAAAMKAAFGENPKKVYGKKDKMPSTRMATAALIRDALEKAGHYRREKEQYAMNGSGKAAPETNMRCEALLPVLSGEMLLKIHAHRTDDILTAIRIANEFGLRYTLEHCTEGYLIADLLAGEYRAGREEGRGRGQPGLGRLEGIIAGPLMTDRSKPELSRANAANRRRASGCHHDRPSGPADPISPCQRCCRRPRRHERGTSTGGDHHHGCPALRRCRPTGQP